MAFIRTLHVLYTSYIRPFYGHYTAIIRPVHGQGHVRVLPCSSFHDSENCEEERFSRCYPPTSRERILPSREPSKRRRTKTILSFLLLPPSTTLSWILQKSSPFVGSLCCYTTTAANAVSSYLGRRRIWINSSDAQAGTSTPPSLPYLNSSTNSCLYMERILITTLEILGSYLSSRSSSTSSVTLTLRQ